MSETNIKRTGSKSSNTVSGKKATLDVRQVITDKIVSLIEDGGAETLKRWAASAAAGGIPVNAATGIGYRGANVLVLLIEAMERGYSAQRWMTYKQAQAMGGQVRKGEKSVMCAYWSSASYSKKEEGNDAEELEQGKSKSVLWCKPFYLFNVAQIDGLPDDMYKAPTAERFDHSPIESAEKMIAASGATVRHGFSGAFYTRKDDYIAMPDRESFYTAEAYYATLTHELTHWTGHASRLDREFGKRFGDEAYAFEELIAELGAAFLAAEIGFIDETIAGHADYVAGWLTVLKNDKNAIFTAAKKAGEASEYLCNLLKNPLKKAA